MRHSRRDVRAIGSDESTPTTRPGVGIRSYRPPSIAIRPGIDVELSEPTLLTLAIGEAASATRFARWQARGRSAHDTDHALLSRIRREEDRRIARFLGSPQAASVVRRFVAACMPLYEALVRRDADAFQRRLGRHFCFITGEPRTGGTWLMAELSRAVGQDWMRIPGAHDAFPAFADLTGARVDPGRLHRVRFSLCELLVLQQVCSQPRAHVVKRQTRVSQSAAEKRPE